MTMIFAFILNVIKRTLMNKLSRDVDPMVFPVLFPSGDLGQSIGYNKKPKVNVDNIYNTESFIDTLKSNGKIYNTENFLDTPKSTKKSKILTTLQYYSYRLSYRPHSKNFSYLVFSRRLTQDPIY